MATIEVSGWSDEAVTKSTVALEALARRYRDDLVVRAVLDLDPQPSLFDIGFRFPPGVRVQVVADTNDLMHIVLPADPNLELSDEALDAVAGGNTTSTNSTASTAASAMCSSMPSSASTLSSASTYQPEP